MKRGRRRQLGNAEIALAMELRSERVTWKLIAWGLGVSEETLTSRITKAKRDGMYK